MKRLYLLLLIIIFALFYGKVGFCYSNFSEKVVPYNTQKSELLLRESNLQTFLTLSQSFESQKHPTYCGIATASIILNSMYLPVSDSAEIPTSSYIKKYPHIAIKRYTQENIFSNLTDSVKNRGVIEYEEGSNPGLELKDLSSILKIYGAENKIFYSDGTKEDKAQYKKNLTQYLATSKKKGYIIVNFDRKALGFKSGGGHITPIIAYNKKSDMVLVQDVSGTNNGWFWVDSNLLYNGMNTKDIDLNRGYLIVDSTLVNTKRVENSKTNTIDNPNND